MVCSPGATSHRPTVKCSPGVYLAPRTPLPVNYNYFLVFRDAPAGSLPAAGVAPVSGVSLSQVLRASRLLQGLAAFKAHLDAEKLPPDADKDGPLCSEWLPRVSVNVDPSRG